MNLGLLVSEVFGPTVQGEGPSLGQRASFIRLGACDLKCAWCDSAYTWDRTRYDLSAEMRTRSAADVADEVLAHGTPLVVITGGEPLLQQRREGWAYLIDVFQGRGRRVEVETNGTQVPRRAGGVFFNVSPKLAHSGDSADDRLVPAALWQFSYLAHEDMAAWKFVAQTTADVAEIRRIVREYDVPHEAVWVMPEGVDSAALAARAALLADEVLSAGFNLTTRLHVLLWGQERKR